MSAAADEQLGAGNPLTRSGRLVAGPLHVDIDEHRALLGGRPLELSPLPMHLLAVLLGNAGRLVTRDELRRRLWPGSERIDTEQRLNTAMKALRHALGDEAESGRFIETVRGKGYRWIGPAPRREVGRRRPGLALAAAAALGAAAIGGLALLRAASEPAAIATPTALLDAQAALDRWRAAPDQRRLAAAEEAVTRAMRLSASSPTANVLDAELAMEAHWDWPRAEASFARALEIDPGNADARLGRAWLRVNRGDTAGALADANQLLLEARLSGERRTELGWLFIRAGRPDLARSACPPDAGSLNGLSCAHTAMAQTGDFAAAKSSALALMRAASARPDVIAAVEAAADEDAYRRFLQWRAREFLPANASLFDRAQVLADAGYVEEAVALLDRSVAAREPKAAKIYSSTSFVTLRTHPRFQALVRAVGIAIGPDARTRG